jgi:ABC-2 type transport system permease protein
MRNIWILFKREMMAYFFSPIAYIVAVCMLALTGISFDIVMGFLNGQPGSYSALQWFFNGIFTWIILLVVPPVIAMRLFAEEKKTGILEGIMTAPLRDTEYVLAKFLSAFLFYIILWTPTFAYIFILRNSSNDSSPLDMGPIMGGYISIFLVGMLFISMGCFASSVTRNQIIAAIISFVLCAGTFFISIYFYMNTVGPNRNFFEYIAIYPHMQELTRGVLDWRRVFFYLSSSGFFLFLTHRVVQSRQWKS